MKRAAWRSAGILAATLLAACGAGESGDDAPSPSGDRPGQASEAAAAQAADGHLDLALAVDGQGGCTFHWEGAPVAAAGLSAVASTAMSRDIARQGGPSNVVSLPQVWVRGAATIPYRCLGGALRALERGGVSHARLVLPERSSDRDLPYVVLELPQATDAPPPPIEPVKNEIVVTAEGVISWNGTTVDLVRLRQYLDITTNMRPTPETHLQPAPQARLQDVETVLAAMKMANVRDVVLLGTDLQTGRQFEMVAELSEPPEPALE